MPLENVGINIYEKSDYPLLKSWWEKRGFPVPEEQFLPPTGRILTIDKVPYAAGFLFKTDANVGVIGHFVSDPDHPDKSRRKAGIDFLVTFLSDLAKEQGMKLVCCSTNIPKLGERFKQKGFQEADKNVTMYGRIL